MTAKNARPQVAVSTPAMGAEPGAPATHPPAIRPPLRRRGSARVIPEAATVPGPIIERPDGWYWLAADGRQQFGPFETQAAALADRDAGDEGAPAEGESLVEAEAELGLADWIDPETGALAEGRSLPHLGEAR